MVGLWRLILVSPGPGGQDKRIISSFISNKFRYQALICRDPANFGKLKIKRSIFLVIFFNIYNDLNMDIQSEME